MQWDEMVDVLAVVTISDGRRTFVELDVAWWLSQANYAGWPSREFAVAAIMKHTADHPDKWLSPGHITGYWREVRSEAAQSFSPPAPPPDAIDDPAASQRSTEAAFANHLARKIDKFIDPMRAPMHQLQRSIDSGRSRRRGLPA